MDPMGNIVYGDNDNFLLEYNCTRWYLKTDL